MTIQIEQSVATPAGRKHINIEELAVEIGKSTNTIRTCSTNEKYFHLIPRPFKFPFSRRLRWWWDEVEAWKAQARQVNPTGKRGRGRPTKNGSVKRTTPNNQ